VQKSGEPRSTRLAETFAAPPPTSPPVSPPAEESEHPAAEAPGEGEPEPPVSPQQG
jgi:hypothetical protein